MEHEFDIELVVNDVRRSLRVDARTSLLDALRDGLHLAGRKKAVSWVSAARKVGSFASLLTTNRWRGAPGLSIRSRTNCMRW